MFDKAHFNGRGLEIAIRYISLNIKSTYKRAAGRIVDIVKCTALQ